MPQSSRGAASTTRAGAALVAQAKLTGEWLGRLDDEQFRRTVGSQGRTVRDLTAVLLVRTTGLGLTLGEPTTGRPVPLATHLRTQRDWIGTDARDADTMTEPGPALARDFAQEVLHIEELMGGQLPVAVESRYDAVRTVDLLRGHLLDLMAFSDDIAAVVPEQGPAPVATEARLDAARTYAELIGSLHPGHTIELRIPPAAAVQLATVAGGPVHTRGTPPTVVETDPLTFLRLCNGRRAWSDALAARAVHASGVHADLSGVFPVYAPAA